MAVIAAIMLERLNLATRLAANSQAMTQARFYALSAESIATSRIKALVATSPIAPPTRAGCSGAISTCR